MPSYLPVISTFGTPRSWPSTAWRTKIPGSSERQRRGIGTLPANLLEAIHVTEKSELVQKALGDHVFHAFIENKKIEWDQYRTQVTEYELKRYLPIL